MTISKPKTRTFGIIVTFMFHSFFIFPRYLSLFSHSFNFTQFYSKVRKSASSLFIMIIIRSSRLAEIKWSVCISKSQRSLYISISDRFWVVHMPFVRMVKLQLLAQLPVDHLATQSSLVLYYFCGNLLLCLIMWLMVSSLSPHNLHLLFCCV